MLTAQLCMVGPAVPPMGTPPQTGVVAAMIDIDLTQALDFDSMGLRWGQRLNLDNYMRVARTGRLP